MWAFTAFVVVVITAVLFYFVSEQQTSNLKASKGLINRLEFESSLMYLQARLDDITRNRSGFRLLPTSIKVMNAQESTVANSHQDGIIGISQSAIVRSVIQNGNYVITSTVFIGRVLALLFVVLSVSYMVTKAIQYQIISALNSGTKAFKADFNSAMEIVSERIKNAASLNGIGSTQIDEDQNIEEVSQVILSTNKLLSEISKLHSQILELSSQEAKFLLALQISHDVRSPLSALNLAVSKMPASDNKIKEIIVQSARRINEIANDLLTANKRGVSSKVIRTNQGFPDVVNIKQVAHEILLEKRTIWGSSVNLQFDCKIEQDIFSFGKNVELKRILSNLLNNSFEALENQYGTIVLAIRHYEDKISIFISDEGKGMDSETLAKLGTKGFSFGKTDSLEAGNGLGFYHAKLLIESWGGGIMVSSKLNQGTIVEVRLERS